MDPVTVGVLTSALSTIVIAVLAVGGRMMLRGMKGWMNDEIRHHLVPNGGSSLADKLNRIEANTEHLMKLHESPHDHAHTPDGS